MKIQFLRFSLVLLILIWCPLYAKSNVNRCAAAPCNPLLEAGIERSSVRYLQEKLSKIKTMQADFSQTITANNMDSTKSSGKMALSKPNLFFWKTIKPLAQTFVADGKKIWIYDEDLEQVSVRNQNQNLSGAAAIFLTDNTKDLAKDYSVNLATRNGQEQFNLRAIRKNVSFVKVGLIFVDDIIRQIDLFDELGQHTVIFFNQVKLNAKLPPNFFKFIVPKGTDVVHQ